MAILQLVGDTEAQIAFERSIHGYGIRGDCGRAQGIDEGAPVRTSSLSDSSRSRRPSLGDLLG
jgi:hypothetical protein